MEEDFCEIYVYSMQYDKVWFENVKLQISELTFWSSLNRSTL